MSHRRLPATLLAALVASTLAPALAQAHVEHDAGAYRVTVGWLHEPTYVDVENAIQVLVADDQGKPVADLGDAALTVVVSAAGRSSAALPLLPTLDPDSGEGTPGEYVATLIPTVPGDYSFHIQGSIHGTAVDETVASSDTTFDPVSSGAEAQFPVTLPATSDLVTRIDRLTDRLQAAQSSAQQALVVGAGVGLLGVIIGLVALGLGLRPRRRVP